MSVDTFDPHALLKKIRGSQQRDSSPTRSEYKRTQDSSFSHSSHRRQERSEMRQELENQIQNLVEEVSCLKAANRQLQEDKIEMEELMMDQKAKSDAIIAKLRNHVVTLNKKINNAKQSSPPAPSRNPQKAPLNNKHKPKEYKSFNRSDSSQKHPKLNDFVSSRSESFATPTFSEMMRRVTPETESFTDTLRRSTTTTTTHTNHHGASHHHVPYDAPFPPPPPGPDYSDYSFDRTGGGTGRGEDQGFGGSAHHHLSGGGDMSHDTNHFVRRQRSSSDEGSGGNGGGGFGRSGSMSSVAGANLHSPADESHHHHADRLTHHNHSYVVRGSQRAGEVVGEMDGGEEVRVELDYNNDDDDDDDDLLPVVDIDLRY